MAERLHWLTPAASETQREREAEAYWTRDDVDDSWRSNSHWHASSAFESVSFHDVGREHFDLFARLARTAAFPTDRLGRVLEWGCGGGANATQFALRADEFVAVDVSAASVAECRRQVEAVCSTPVVELPIELRDPEAVLDGRRATCDVFLCLYVLELVPTQAYGIRLVGIARELLRPGGLAFVQVKYATADPATWARRRRYAANVARMTTYAIDEFWAAAADRGLEPLAVSIVPRNALDERYAYFLLQRPE